MKKLLSSAVIAIAVSTSAASASVIGLFGDYSGSKSSLYTNLTNLGHTVTDLGTDINQSLVGFDSVWGVSAFNAVSSSEQTYLADFLSTGGGVYLTGERPCCETLNSSLTTFVNSVVVGGGVQVGGIGDQGSFATINQNVVGGLATSPNAVSTWSPSASGGMLGVSGDNVLATSTSTSNVVAAAWDMSDLVGNSGRMALMMDVNWLTSYQLGLLENIEVFLAGATSQPNVSVPAPGGISLLGLGLAGLLLSRKKKAA